MTQKINKGHSVIESIATRLGGSAWTKLQTELAAEDKLVNGTVKR